MHNTNKPTDKWIFFFRKNDNMFHFENNDFSFNLSYSYCSNVNSPERTYNQPMHKHSHYEMHMILDGSFRYETENKEIFEVKKGEFIVHRPGLNHRIISESDVFSKFVMCFYFSSKDSAKTNFYRLAQKRIAENKIFPYTKKMYTIFEMILKLSQETPYEYKNSFFFLSISFIMEMLRVIVGNEKLNTVTEYNDLRINSAIDFIKSNIDANLKVPDVSKYLHLSTRQFTKIFTETTGIPPGTFIKKYRTKYMADLLSNSDLCISDIASILGYPDSAAFVKAFKRAKGITPAKYRKTHKKI